MLPLDVIDHILSFLQWERAALTSCSEAHPFLSGIAERHLFAHITVQNVPCSEPYTFNHSQLYELLCDNPRRGIYVRSLRVEVFRPAQPQSLRHIFPMLPLLERIALACRTGVEQAVWGRFPKKFQQDFMDCLRLPTMKELYISDVTDFPLFSLDSSGTLKVTLTGRMQFDEPKPSSSAPTSIGALSIYRCPPTSNMLSWARTQNLRTLRISGQEEDFTRLQLLFRVWNHSLTSLDLDLGYGLRSQFNLNHIMSTPAKAQLFLPELPVLEQLTVRSDITLHHQIWVKQTAQEVLRFYKSALPAIVALVLDLKSPSLKHISLYLHISFNGPFSFSDLDWSPVGILSQLGLPIDLRISANKSTLHIPAVDIHQALRKVDLLSKLVERHALVLKGEEDRTYDFFLNN